MTPPDVALRSAAAATGAGMSVLPLVAGGTAIDVGFVIVGVLAAAGALLRGQLPGARLRSALPTVCLLAAVGDLAVRAVSPAVSAAEAVLVAGYLALACEAEISRDTVAVRLRWAAAPLALATVGAGAAAAAATLADRAGTPLAIVGAGVAAVGLLFLELHRRRAGTAAAVAAADGARRQ